MSSTESGVFAEHRALQAPMRLCPHCLRTVPDLSAHLRDDGGAGTRCPELTKKALAANIGECIDLTKVVPK